MNPLVATIAQTQGTPPTSQGNPMLMFLPLMAAMIVFMLLSSRSQRKRQERERTEMYAKMTKNHRVQTVGGVIGTVISVKDNEVVLKVDESTNTKMTFLKSAVQRIITDGPSDEGK